MNNNEKKVKYFLRKTAYGLASMSAAFIVCSGIVNTPTVSADSNSTIKAESVGGIKHVESVHTLKPVSIPKEQLNNELTKQKHRGELTIKSLGFITSDEQAKLIQDMNKIEDPNEGSIDFCTKGNTKRQRLWYKT